MIAPAMAADVKAEAAPVSGDSYKEFALGLLSSDSAINGVSAQDDGTVVVMVTEADLDESTVVELASYDNLVIQERGPIKAYAQNDIVGGAGYYVPYDAQRGFVCSIGFSAWTPSGDPALITAGHCGLTGDQALRSAPSADDAHFYPDRSPGISLLDDEVPMGEFTFSQWGGPGGSEGTEGDLSSTDIATIDVTNTNLTLRPFVTDWSTSATDDLSSAGTTVKYVGTAKTGDEVIRSGRTTGQHSGTVLDDNMYVNVCEEVVPEPINCHVVYGFETDAFSLPGDSGGPFMVGDTAVGVLSGGDANTSFATHLLNGLAQVGSDYTVMLDIDAPSVTSDTTVEEGATISGTSEPNRTIYITVDGVTTEVVADGAGQWSFPAPAAGNYTYTIVAGDHGEFNRSNEITYVLTVEEGAEPTPTPTPTPTATTDPTPTSEPTVTPTQTPGGEGGGGNGNLPATGLDTGATITFTLLGAGVLVAGAVVLLIARKRSHALVESSDE